MLTTLLFILFIFPHLWAVFHFDQFPKKGSFSIGHHPQSSPVGSFNSIDWSVGQKTAPRPDVIQFTMKLPCIYDARANDITIKI